MKKLLFTLSLFSLLFISNQAYAQAGWGCHDNVSFSLAPFGMNALTADMLVEPDPNVPLPSTLELSSDNQTFIDVVLLGCESLGVQTFYVRDSETGANCEVLVTVEDHIPPIAVCFNLSSAVLINGVVELYAIDFDGGSSDFCTSVDDLRFIYGSIDHEFTETQLANDFYFNDNGFISFVSSAAPSVVSAYNSGVIQRWNEGVNSSSRIYTESGEFTVVMNVSDALGNFNSCFLELTINDNSVLACIGNLYVSLDTEGTAELGVGVFVQGYASPSFQVSRDGVNFDDTVEFNCDDIGGIISVTVLNTINNNSCTTDVVVEDKIGPHVASIEASFDLEDPLDVIVLEESDIVSSVHENCSSYDLSFSPNTFDVYDLGYNTVTITVSDENGNTNTFTTTVYITLYGDPFATICLPEVNVSTDPWTCETAEIDASDVYIGNAQHATSYVSLDNENFSLTLTDFPHELGSQFTVYVETVDDGISTFCSSEVTIVDMIAPVVVIHHQMTIQLIDNGQGQFYATITPEDVDNGSYDQCSSIELLIARNQEPVLIGNGQETLTFNSTDIGENIIRLFAQDESGNWNSTWNTVIVQGGGECSGSVLNAPLPLIQMTVPVVENLTPENLILVYGYSAVEVQPTWPASCDGFLKTYTDNLISTGNNGFRIIRLWTVLNWYSSEVIEYTQIIKTYTPEGLYCVNELLIEEFTGSHQVNVADLVFDISLVPNLFLVITNINGEIVEDNIFSESDIGQTFTYELFEMDTWNSCSGLITLSAAASCAYDVNNIDWPNALIVINDNTITDISPENLVENYGFTTSEVNVILNQESCNLVSVNYNDIVVDLGGGYFKLVREFTVVDWTEYDSETEGVWHFTQLIKNIDTENSNICDFLPRNAAIGDCDSGHTLEDDVEWPNDIEISDYHIEPNELVSYSGVDPLDAQPTLYNNLSSYNMDHNDELVAITATTIELNRVWTISHVSIDLSWEYGQSIIIDFSEFEDLVSVNTISGRVMPNVIVNGVNYTDVAGELLLTDPAVFSMKYVDEGTNGIDIVDLGLIQYHILKIQELDLKYIPLADFDLNEKINGSDMILLRRGIIGKNNFEDDNWIFVDDSGIESSFYKPKGNYVAYKLGDVNDSALLEGDVPQDPIRTISFDDVLLNNGQSYDIPVKLNASMDSRGIQIRMKLDPTKVRVNNISSDLFSINSSSWFVTDEGILTVLLTDVLFDTEVVSGGVGVSPLLNLNITALDNTLLHSAIDVDALNSISVNDDFEKDLINSSVSNLIINAVYDEALVGLKVYPNPATDYLKIDMSNVDLKGTLSVTIYDLQGQMLLKEVGSTNMDLSSLVSGMYYYKVSIDGHSYSDKLSVIK